MLHFRLWNLHELEITVKDLIETAAQVDDIDRVIRLLHYDAFQILFYDEQIAVAVEIENRVAAALAHRAEQVDNLPIAHIGIGISMENAAFLRILVEGVVAGLVKAHLLDPLPAQRAQVCHPVRHEILLAVCPGLIAIDKDAAVRLIRIMKYHFKLRKGYGLLR